MHTTKILILLTLHAVCLAGIARADTLRVEQNGSGDFTIIQDAVDAAAHGDTILIGPGHYQDTHDHDQEGGPIIQVVASWLDERVLSFIGTERDSVIIGPDEFSSPRVYGIVHPEIGDALFQKLTFENCYDCIVTFGGGVVQDCQFTNVRSAIGVLGYGSGEFQVLQSTIADMQDFGPGLAIWNIDKVTIRDCVFDNHDFYLEGVSSFEISNNTFNRRVGSVVASDGRFEGNTAVVYSNKALYVVSGSDVVVEGCEFSVFPDGPLNANLSVREGDTHVELYRNVFNGGSYAAIEVLASPTVFGEENHFLKGTSDFTIILQYCSNPFLGSVDLRNNYWGTDDPEQVAQWIYDGADDPDLAIEVQYLPFSAEPMPTEPSTLGGFRSMFR